MGWDVLVSLGWPAGLSQPQSETGHSWRNGNFACTWLPLTSDSPLVNIRKVYLWKFPRFSDPAIAEGEITPCNHDFGPEMIIHPFPLKVGGPCSPVTNSPPNPSPHTFSHGSLPSGFCWMQLYQARGEEGQGEGFEYWAPAQELRTGWEGCTYFLQSLRNFMRGSFQSITICMGSTQSCWIQRCGRQWWDFWPSGGDIWKPSLKLSLHKPQVRPVCTLSQQALACPPLGL